MINHSCVPNAVRVFACDDTKEYMIVHACQDIGKGNEIEWSYIPVTESYTNRYKYYKFTHGFVCQCPRCQLESSLWKTNEYIIKLTKQISQQMLQSTNTSEQLSSLTEIVNLLEKDLLVPNNTIVTSSNELKRYIRIGFFPLYLQFINLTLLECQQILVQQGGNDPVTNDIVINKKKDLLTICTQLHFAFVTCHNASTEHISVSSINQ